MAKSKNHFKLHKITNLKDIKEGSVDKIDTSDLSIQGEDFIAQYRFVEVEREKPKKYEITPGIYTMVSGLSGVVLEEFEMKKQNLLESVNNTKAIRQRADQFFNNLDIYDELEQPKIRNVLIYSDPGFGKSSTINKICLDFLEEDPNTVVISWNTSSLRSSDVERFFSLGSNFNKKVSRMIFIIEDIGGGEQEFSGNRSVDSSLLNLLDGNSVNFRVPTFTLATTNYPANLLSALADRPGRFDEMFKLEAPSADERVALAAFFKKSKLSDEEEEALRNEKLDHSENGFSIAHIKEIVIRSRLTGKKYKQIIKDMLEHKEKMEKGFTEGRSVGLY